MTKNKKNETIGHFVFSQQYHEIMHYQQINRRKSAFSMQFRYKFCNALYDFYLLYGSEIFSVFFIRSNRSTEEIKKKALINAVNTPATQRKTGFVLKYDPLANLFLGSKFPMLV